VNYTKNDVMDNLCLFKMDRIIQYIVFLVFHGKSTTFFKQLVKKFREITEVEHKIGKSLLNFPAKSLADDQNKLTNITKRNNRTTDQLSRLPAIFKCKFVCFKLIGMIIHLHTGVASHLEEMIQ
jgi:hypothetical protein